MWRPKRANRASVREDVEEKPGGATLEHTDTSQRHRREGEC